VNEQVKNVCNTTIVQNTWKAGVELSVNGWIYNINNGILKDLGTCITSTQQLEAQHEKI
jgi:carbonic anhydrase